MALIRAIIESMRRDEIEQSVLVLNIPPGTTEDSLFIHFQRRKHGGGDVSSVKFLQGVSEDGTTAIVTFEDAESKLYAWNSVLSFVTQVICTAKFVHKPSVLWALKFLLWIAGMSWFASRQYGDISSRDDAIRGLSFYGPSTCSCRLGSAFDVGIKLISRKYHCAVRNVYSAAQR